MKHDCTFLLIINILIIIAVVPIEIESANILAIFPSVWRSHYIFGSSILKKLALNGHNITIITGLTSIEVDPYDKTDNSYNKQIIIPLIQQNWIDSGLSFEFEDIKKISALEYFTRMVYASTSNVDIILKNHNIQELIANQGNKFDIIIGDIFLCDAFLGFTYRFNCPIVIISPTGNNKWLDEMTGNPNTASRNPSSFLSLSEEMNLSDRIRNTLMNIFEKLSYNFFHFMYQEKIYQRYFKNKTQKNNLPTLKTLIENIDLVLLNSNPLIEYPNAYLPNIIEIGGAHINGYNTNKNFPLDLKRFLDHSGPTNIIYINFGANLNTGDLPEDKLKELLSLVNELDEMNYKIILSWEKVEKPIKSDNVFVKYWLPQQEILSHPNVKLFITSGGSMSIMEAIFYEKLILGIPILPQHEFHLKRLQSLSYGVLIENYEHLNKNSMVNKIKNLLKNESYNDNNKKISQKFRNVPNNPMNLSTYYIELLIKEKRLNYLKPSFNKMNFIQRELIDVIVIILLGTVVIIGLPSIVICFILRKSNGNNNNSISHNNTNINNKFLSNNIDISASAFLKKIIKAKNLDIKNKHKYKRN